MYRYEELGLEELLMDPDVSVESPEALYAIAQCYRLGKGTKISLEQYREYLQAAMEAGSSEAEKEWAQLDEGKTAEEAENVQEAAAQPKEDLSASTLPELISRLEQNEADMRVHYELYRRFCKLEPKEAFRHLERAAKLAERGEESLDYTLCRNIFMDMGACYAGGEAEDPRMSLTYYGRAAELGSLEADRVLAEYYKKGYGTGKPDMEKSLFYRTRALENGTDQERYELGLEYIKCGLKIKGYAVLEELQNKKELDERLRVLCEIKFHPGRTEEEVVRAAWALGDWKGGVREYLYSYYRGRTPENLPEEVRPTPEQAFVLGQWNRESAGEYGSWMEWSAQNGYEQAEKCLEEERLEKERRRKEMQEKEAERERQEQERREREKLERERQERERLERERQEQERLKRERQDQERSERERQKQERREDTNQKENKVWKKFFVLFLIILAAGGIFAAGKAVKTGLGAKKTEGETAMETAEETVENDSTKLDPFADLQIRISGASPYVSVEAAYMGTDPILQNTEFQLSKEHGLADGETVVIEAKPAPSYEEAYQETLSIDRMNYTVETEEY